MALILELICKGVWGLGKPGAQPRESGRAMHCKKCGVAWVRNVRMHKCVASKVPHAAQRTMQ